MKKLLFATMLLLGLLGCASDDDNYHLPDNETEEITRVVLRVSQGTDTVDYTFNSALATDADQINLKPNQTYQVEVQFWNDDEDPAENVTNEVADESDEHLLCFDVLDNTNVSITIDDKDENGLPIGLKSTWATGSASNGGIELVLKHQPDLKNTFNGQVNCSVGETDVDVPFPVKIE